MSRKIIVATIAALVVTIILVGLNKFEFLSPSKSTTVESTYPATIEEISHSESPKPVVKLIEVKTSGEILTIILSIADFSIVQTNEDINNYVCDPAISSDRNVNFVLQSKQGALSTDQPILVTYDYAMNNEETFDDMTVELLFTLGPCGNFADNSNATPSPSVNIIANYSIKFTVNSD